MAIDAFLRLHQIQFRQLSFYEEAFSHPSFKQGDNGRKDYQKLEFLGDAILNGLVAELCYTLRKDLDEGGLTILRSTLVNTNSLATIAKELKIIDFVQLGKSMSKEELATHKKVLEDVFEAFVGALYLDLGFDQIKDFIQKLFMPRIMALVSLDLKDYKSTLQEKLQSEKRDNVAYLVTSKTGPQHDPTFTVEVRFADLILGVGMGHSKKEAEQNAARDALNKEA
ncbi:MAG: ribonuclease III [Erysipelotrichaceae bacterium]|jgi:ribonuclease-3|nr:ribonuclease III [Erysipelotrichaceae bacterium]